MRKTWRFFKTYINIEREKICIATSICLDNIWVFVRDHEVFLEPTKRNYIINDKF